MEDHQVRCITCGKIIDCRELGEVLAHGNFNDKTGKFYCSPVPVKVQFSSALRIGDYIQYSVKTPIHLN